MIAKQETPYKKVIQTGVVIIMSGVLALLTGCGSPSGSTGPTSSINPEGTGLSATQANASEADIKLLKEANGKLGLDASQPNQSNGTNKTPTGISFDSGTVTVTFRHPRLNEYVAANGLTQVPYTLSGDSFSTFNFDSESIKMNGKFYNLNQSGDFYEIDTPMAGESCQDCYFIYFKQTKDNITTLIADFKWGTIENSYWREQIPIDANNTSDTTRFLTVRVGEFILSLAPDGAYRFLSNTKTQRPIIDLFGPFELSRNGVTYRLVNHLILPIDTSKVNTLVFKLFNRSGLEIGEATFDVLKNTKFSFKVYVNGVLTPVSSL